MWTCKKNRKRVSKQTCFIVFHMLFSLVLFSYKWKENWPKTKSASILYIKNYHHFSLRDQHFLFFNRLIWKIKALACTLRSFFVISTMVSEANSDWICSTCEVISLWRVSCFVKSVAKAFLWHFSSSRRFPMSSFWCCPLLANSRSIAWSFSISLKKKWISITFQYQSWWKISNKRKLILLLT